jgi:archaemetzincin
MKSAFIIATLLYFTMGNCKRQSIISLNNKTQTQIIAIQPLDNYNEKELISVREEIRWFYNKKVIILKSIEIPLTFYNPIAKKYSADSIINLLSKLHNDTVVEIVGITHKPIYTVKENKHGPYYDESIFGMGYLPGNSCVISDNRFWINDSAIFNFRLRNVIIHEIGHNAGLPHCPDNTCIMSIMSGDVLTLDYGRYDYCKKCKKKMSR